MNSAFWQSDWAVFGGLVAAEVALIGAVAWLVQARMKTASARSLVWQSALLAVFAVTMGELAGAGPALVRSLHAEVAVEAPPVVEAEPALIPPLATVGMVRVEGGNPLIRELVAQKLAEKEAALEPGLEIGAQPTAAPVATVQPRIPIEWAWGAGTLALLALLGLRRAGFWFCSLRFKKTDCPQLLARIRAVAERLGMRSVARALTSKRLATPVAFGLLRPTVGLPDDFESANTDARKDAMLAHELAHLHARDTWWHLGADLMVALFWWHPIAWWIARRLKQASESAADEASACIENGPEALAECLVDFGKQFADRSPANAIGMAGDGYRSRLGNRVEALLKLPGDAGTVRKTKLSSLRRLGTAVALSGIGMFLVACCAPDSAGDAKSPMTSFKAHGADDQTEQKQTAGVELPDAESIRRIEVQLTVMELNAPQDAIYGQLDSDSTLVPPESNAPAWTRADMPLGPVSGSMARNLPNVQFSVYPTSMVRSFWKTYRERFGARTVSTLRMTIDDSAPLRFATPTMSYLADDEKAPAHELTARIRDDGRSIEVSVARGPVDVTQITDRQNPSLLKSLRKGEDWTPPAKALLWDTQTLTVPAEFHESIAKAPLLLATFRIVNGDGERIRKEPIEEQPPPIVDPATIQPEYRFHPDDIPVSDSKPDLGNPDMKSQLAELIQDGKMLYELRWYNEAEKKLRKAIELDPKAKAAFYYLARVQEAMYGYERRAREAARNQKLVDVERAWNGGLPLKSTMLPEPPPVVRTNTVPKDQPVTRVFKVDPERFVENLNRLTSDVDVSAASKPGGLMRGFDNDGATSWTLRFPESEFGLRFRALLEEAGVNLDSKKDRDPAPFHFATNVFFKDTSGRLMVMADPRTMDIVQSVVERLNGAESALLGGLRRIWSPVSSRLTQRRSLRGWKASPVSTSQSFRLATKNRPAVPTRSA